MIVSRKATMRVAELLGPFERDQVAAPGDDVELGAVNLGDDVLRDWRAAGLAG